MFNHICNTTINTNGIFCYNYIKNNKVEACCRPNGLLYKCNYEYGLKNFCSYQIINDPLDIFKVFYKYYLILLSFVSAIAFLISMLYLIINICKKIGNICCCKTKPKPKMPDFALLSKKNKKHNYHSVI